MSRTSTPTAQIAPVRRWTVRDAVGESRPPARTIALLAAAIALLCTVDARVPIACGVTIAFLVPAVLVDLIERRLPNRLVAMAAGAGVAALTIELLAGARHLSVGDGLVGALSMAGPLLVAHLVAPESMGFGDVKTALVLGAALGLVDPILGLGALAIGSAGTAMVGIVIRRRNVAFGPGLFGGAVVVLVLVVLNVVATR